MSAVKRLTDGLRHSDNADSAARRPDLCRVLRNSRSTLRLRGRYRALDGEAVTLDQNSNLLKDPVTEVTAGPVPDGSRAPTSAVHLTRGFLFADVRGYASFVETRGDDAPARARLPPSGIS